MKKQAPAVQSKSWAPFAMKALDEEARTFEGLASTWNEDLGGDVIHRGAFKATLKEWKASKRVLPLIDQHNYGSIRSVVGRLLEAKETEDGLEIKSEIISGPDGDEVMRRLKGGFIDGLSIGYEPKKWEYEQNDDAMFGRIRHIKEVKLYEVSLVIWGMNPNALVDSSSVKALELLEKDPDELNEDERKDLRRLATRIGSVLRPKSAEPPAAPAAAAAPVAPVAPVVEPVKPDATPLEADSQKGTTEEPVYLYAEALQQRLLGLKLHRTRNQTQEN